MGVIELKDGYLLRTYDMSVIPTEKTYIIMAKKIQRWWKPIYYKILIKKAFEKRYKH
jgi:hypothetical protein